MMHRILIEFVVDVPNADVAGDVMTRLTREHPEKLRETLKSITGFDPLSAPGRIGILVGQEPVTWSAAEEDWIGEDDGNDGDDE